jgi:hypothetical protein
MSGRCEHDRVTYGWPASWEPVDETWLEWLAAAGSDHGTGYDVGDLPDSAWVLHAMYERFDGTSAVVPDASAPNRPDRYQRSNNDGIPWAHDPGPQFRRLRWHDYAKRTGNGFVQSPSKGSMDVESWTHLVDLLRRQSPRGDDTVCTAYYLGWTSRCLEDMPYLFRGRLGDASTLIEHPHYGGSPQNLWPDDQSWVVYTDWDLCATRVSGPAALIEALLNEPFLEVDRSPDVPRI